MKHLKEEFDKLTIRELLSYVIATGCMAAAVVAIYLGMYLPPEGEVHSSVLTYFGISAAFCGSLLGISMHYSSELHRFKEQIRETLRDGTTHPE